MPETSPHTVTIAKQRFELRRDRVERALRGVLPEPISTHYVVVGARRYPPKQVIGLVTGIDRADFTSHQARRVLMGLGFAVGRRPSGAADALGRVHVETPVDTSLSRAGGPIADASPAAYAPAAPSVSAADRELAEALRPLRGEWVAIKDGELLVATPTPKELVGWLARHDRRADSMFRVPEDELALAGLAPL
ncbi:MAG TPA: hypothetical protein VNU28_02755 [Solirubrobacteraceae bacterium]|nr:hypothetical protein [Solirubrobacteraceae bacterium]